jgi:hypothetical protein
MAEKNAQILKILRTELKKQNKKIVPRKRKR